MHTAPRHSRELRRAGAAGFASSRSGGDRDASVLGLHGRRRQVAALSPNTLARLPPRLAPGRVMLGHGPRAQEEAVLPRQRERERSAYVSVCLELSKGGAIRERSPWIR